MLVALASIVPNPNDVRRSGPDDQADGLLRASIQAHGLLHNLVVRPQPDGTFLLVAGHRRLRVLQALGWTEAPCTVLDGLDDNQVREAAFAENAHRLSLTVAEKCRFVAQYREFVPDVAMLAKRLHLHPKTVKQYLAIATLDDAVLQRLDANDETRLTLKQAMQMAQAAQATQPLASDTADETTASGAVAAAVDAARSEPRKPRARSLKQDPWTFDHQGKPVPIPETAQAKVWSIVQRYHQQEPA